MIGTNPGGEAVNEKLVIGIKNVCFHTTNNDLINNFSTFWTLRCEEFTRDGKCNETITLLKGFLDYVLQRKKNETKLFLDYHNETKNKMKLKNPFRSH